MGHNVPETSGIASKHTMSRTRLDWTNFLFVSVAHLAAAFAIVYLAVFHFSWWTIGFGVLWGTLCGLSITGGYHRLFSHSAYSATWPLRAFYLAFGAASVQNSALAWAADHRTHHAHTDREPDPYSIQRGFWWAHIGWVVCKGNRSQGRSLVRDLEADRLCASNTGSTCRSPSCSAPSHRQR